MNAQKFMIASIALVLCAGCSERIARVHYLASIGELKGKASVIRGAKTVLEYKSVSGVPIPDAFSGSGILLELEPGRVQEDVVIQVPSMAQRCVAWRWSAPLDPVYAACSGEVRIKSVSPERVLATVKVASGDLKLKFRRRVEFTQAPNATPKADAARPNSAVNPAHSRVTPLAEGPQAARRGARAGYVMRTEPRCDR